MSQTEKRDPRKGAKPPFGEQEQSLPGSDADLDPSPTTVRRAIEAQASSKTSRRS